MVCGLGGLLVTSCLLGGFWASSSSSSFLFLVFLLFLFILFWFLLFLFLVIASGLSWGVGFHPWGGSSGFVDGGILVASCLLWGFWASSSSYYYSSSSSYSCVSLVFVNLLHLFIVSVFFVSSCWFWFVLGGFSSVLCLGWRALVVSGV